MQLLNSILLKIAIYFSVLTNWTAGLKCPHELGMESGHISSRQILSSSNQDSEHVVDMARLNGPSAWCSAPVRDKYIQIDLKKEHRLGGIATQGHPTQDNWVKYYTIAYSMNAFHWMSYMEYGQDKIFMGNDNSNTIEYRPFVQPFVGRFVRIYPIHPFMIKVACMRLELYGCKKHQVKFCGDPGLPDFGRRVVKGFSVGKSLHFSCYPGFQLSGPKSIKCTEDGTWDNKLPTCKVVLCKPPKLLPNSTIEYASSYNETVMFGEKLFFSCKNGIKGKGLRYIECRYEGWTKLRMKCHGKNHYDQDGPPGSGMSGDDEDDDEDTEMKNFKGETIGTLRNQLPEKDFYFDKN